ncbi:MAG: PadR family transcriptional regulator [Treponema sp. CETP13]|nr:MAG: PadR family transcriptional regulator [Treponema sp. CETP13]
MIPLYILGILLRYGPQHGYMIKKIVSEQLADFTEIKLPTIYYHLEALQKKGFLKANKEKTSSRPEKTIYYITEEGKKEFNTRLKATLKFEYFPTFNADSTFFFSEYLDKKDITQNLTSYMLKLQIIIEHVTNHQKEVLKIVPEEFKNETNIIFRHHLLHYKAEEQWAKETSELLEQQG